MRACSDEKEVKHSIFRQWLGEATVTEEMWVDIIAEDEAFDYSANGSGLSMAVNPHHEETVITSHVEESELGESIISNDFEADNSESEAVV